MNILFIPPHTISLINGGVRRQVLETRDGLIRMGHRVDLLSPADGFDAGMYDVIHVFGASPEMAGVMRLLRGGDALKVISPVMFMERPAHVAAWALRGFDLLSRIGPTFHTDLQMKRECCLLADLVAPNTESEAALVRKAFDLPGDRVTVIPNGVEADRFLNADPRMFLDRYPWRDFILYVGDLGASRKNIRSLLTAWKSTRSLPDLVLIGSLQSDSASMEIRRMIDECEHVHWIGPLDHGDALLESAYAAASTFILPSRFETPGIAAMEAALAGCEIIITAHGGTRDVFDDAAHYLWEGAPGEIVKTVIKAAETPIPSARRSALTNRLASDHDWSEVARQTDALYRRGIARS